MSQEGASPPDIRIRPIGPINNSPLTNEGENFITHRFMDPNVNTTRPIVHQKDLYFKYQNVDLEAEDNSHYSNLLGIKKACRSFKCTPLKWIRSCVPFLEWIRHYQWKVDLKYDLIAAFTVAVMHIPQGMAYALLANLPAIVGIYMAFFPVIVYSFLGTSKHASMGTFAVVCLMTGKESLKYLDNNADNSNYDVVQVTVVITMTVGFCQLAMGFFQMGKISLLLSPPLVGGFTTGAAIHVMTSQVKNLFGLSLPKKSGIFNVPFTYVELVKSIQESNTTTILISGVAILALVMYNELLKVYLSKRIPFPIPIEFIIMVIATIVSYYGKMKSNYLVSIIGDIPTGLPKPFVPDLRILPDVFVGSLIISFVAYAISISLSKLFADKHKYHIDANQELIAMGSSNIVGSFFKCAPISASLARSAVQEAVGGRTQLTGLFSCLLLLVVLLWVGPYFQALPHCVLSAIIIVALKGLLKQALDLPKVWRECSIHGIIWILTFLGTVLLDIEYGLFIGMGISLLTLIWRSNRANISVLGRYEDFDLYTDINACTKAKEIPNIKIVKYSGSLNFATVEYFLASIDDIMALHFANLVHDNDLQEKTFSSTSCDSIVTFVTNISDVESNKESLEKIPGERRVRWMILDLSSVGSIDPGAIKALDVLHTKYITQGIKPVYANCSFHIFESMFKSHFLHHAGNNCFFPTINDAVAYCQLQGNNNV